MLVQSLGMGYGLRLLTISAARASPAAQLNQHMDSQAEGAVVNDVAVALLLYLGEQLGDEFVADLLVQNDVVLELARLQLVHGEELELGHIVTVHVHKYVLDHNDTKLHLLPHLVHPLQQILIPTLQQLLNHRLKEFNSRILDTGVEQLSVLVDDKRIGSAV